MKIEVFCSLLVVVCALGAPPPLTDSKEQEVETIRDYFNQLKDEFRGAVKEYDTDSAERYKETFLYFIDQVEDIAVSFIGIKRLPNAAWDKEEFLLALNLIDVLTRAEEDGIFGSVIEEESESDSRDRKEFLVIIKKLQELAREQPDVALDRDTFLPVYQRFIELAALPSRAALLEKFGLTDFLLEQEKSWLDLLAAGTAS